MGTPKLSDLIIEGCKVIPGQTFKRYFDGPLAGPPFAACAVYTACYAQLGETARGLDPMAAYDRLDEALVTAHGAGLYAWIADPETGEAVRLCYAVEKLNDNRRWSREKIAAWLKERGS